MTNDETSSSAKDSHFYTIADMRRAAALLEAEVYESIGLIIQNPLSVWLYYPKDFHPMTSDDAIMHSCNNFHFLVQYFRLLIEIARSTSRLVAQMHPQISRAIERYF